MPVDATRSTLAEQQLVTAVVQTVAMQDTRLALVVAPDVRWLARISQALYAASGWEQAAIGPELSAWLLAQTTPPTPRLLRQGLMACLTGQDTPLICTDLDLLFEPALQLDPLPLLHQMSRRRPLVACWPGTCAGGLLAYAVPEHTHYRTWSIRTVPDVRLFAC